jgi:hypothetical protein
VLRCPHNKEANDENLPMIEEKKHNRNGSVAPDVCTLCDET